MTGQQRSGPPTQPVEPLAVNTARIIQAGTAVWALALMVSLAIPSLHTGDRSWWPWACVTGLVLGAIGLLYLRRGKGNAAGVQPRPATRSERGG